MMRKLLYVSAFLLAVMAWSQGQTVSGTVTDASDGSGIPGATVLEKGTSNGTVTDIDGKFQMAVSDGAVLQVSFVGYVSTEVAVGSRAVVDVSLKTDVSELAEVVVIGYGAVKKSDVTGSVSSVGERDMVNGLVVAPDQAL